MLNMRQHAEMQNLVVSSSANVAAIVRDIQQAPQSMSLLAPSSPHDGTVAQSISNRGTHRQHWNNIRTRRLMLFQSRLLGKAFELIQQQACGAWTYGFRAYNIRDWDAPVFVYFARNDIVALQVLIKSGQASLLDRDPVGETLLHVGLSTETFPLQLVLTSTSVPAGKRKPRQSSSWCNKGWIQRARQQVSPHSQSDFISTNRH